MGLFDFIRKAAAKVSHAVGQVVDVGKVATKQAFQLAKTAAKEAAPVLKDVAKQGLEVTKTVVTDAYDMAKDLAKNYINAPNKLFGLFENPLFLIVLGIVAIGALMVLTKV